MFTKSERMVIERIAHKAGFQTDHLNHFQKEEVKISRDGREVAKILVKFSPREKWSILVSTEAHIKFRNETGDMFSFNNVDDVVSLIRVLLEALSQ